jgi:hypothetical protein
MFVSQLVGPTLGRVAILFAGKLVCHCSASPVPTDTSYSDVMEHQDPVNQCKGRASPLTGPFRQLHHPINARPADAERLGDGSRAAATAAWKAANPAGSAAAIVSPQTAHWRVIGAQESLANV